MKQVQLNCTSQQPPQGCGAVSNPILVGLKWLLAFLSVQVTLGTPLKQTIFTMCIPLNDCRRVACSLFKIGVPALFSCLSLARLLILLFLLMSSNVHPNPCLIFPRSVCAGNVTWWGRSVQCCTCSNWVNLNAHYSPFLDSELLAGVTAGAALPAVSFLFLEISHLSAL